MTEDPLVTDDGAGGQPRLTLTLGDHTGVLNYHLENDRLVLDHTEVPEELGGRGVGGRLVRAALTRAEADGLTVVPRCPFARAWLEKHPEATASVAVDWA